MNAMQDFLMGFVKIKVWGEEQERFLNICRKRGIFFRDIEKKDQELIMATTIGNFKNLRSVAKKTGVRVRIQRKLGLPFFLNRMVKRKFFIGGFLLLCIVMFFFTRVVSDVKIVKYGDVDEEKVRDILFSLGAKKWTLKSKVDPDRLTYSMLKHQDFSWVFVKFSGTRLIVSVASKKKAPEMIPKEEPCDIVAAYDSMVQSIIVKAGTAKVKGGDTIRKGELLIAGEIEFKNGEKRKTHALGEVIGRRWFSVRSRIETEYFEKIFTGNVAKGLFGVYNQRKFILINNMDNENNYDKIDFEFGKNIPGIQRLPFGIGIRQYHQTALVLRKVEYEQAVRTAREKAQSELNKMIPMHAALFSQDETVLSEEDGSKWLELTAEVRMEIGMKQKSGG